MIPSTTRNEINKELLEAAKVIAVKYGMNVSNKGGSYSDSDYTLKICFDIPEVTQLKNESLAPMLELPMDIIGQSFHYKTKIFTVESLNPSRPKNAVSLKDQNGKGFRCSVDQLKRFMKI